MNTARTCQQCGKILPTDAPEGLCPQCLMACALASTAAPGSGECGGTVAALGDGPRRGLPRAGEPFGGYRIVRELGRGGMGAVYEAEHPQSGRRVALKALSRQLDSPESHRRFLREGRLAASINHPNSVYVYGTEEIDGTPVIAMELVAGGTLQQRVQREGPMPVAQAVDAILQVIAGLEAAQALGILHRDIKPSNCFQDVDGTVKVGDFGLSISSAARGDTNVTAPGVLLGTPAFASPEQLRGDELNARSDLYSVGVTLFFLLTGRTPFEAPNVVRLIANVLEQTPPSPKTLQPAVPQDLARVVLRCLEKQPSERPRSYGELREALAPFSSAAPVAATPVTRLAAGALDMLVVGAIGMATSLLVFGDLLPFAGATALRPARVWPIIIVAFLEVVAYYSLFEGIWGASVGKALLRLRVTGPDRNPPGVPRALVRTLIFQAVPALPYWVSFGIDPAVSFGSAGPAWQYTISTLYYLMAMVIFVPARRRNGYAGLHDLATGARVVRTLAYQERPRLALGNEASPVAETDSTVGPYHIIGRLESADSGGWLLGYDPQLLRKVWVHAVPAGTPPVPMSLRNLGRIGRLRWVTGSRGNGGDWDAYEAPTGVPLVNLARTPQPWGRVRFWLLDLAREVLAAAADGTLPEALALDRVWITADGRAKLLDFPAPGLVSGGAGPAPTDSASEPGSAGPSASDRADQVFLGDVARVAMQGLSPAATGAAHRGVGVPLPLSARDVLTKLPGFATTEALVVALEPLMQQVASVSRWRRLGLVAGCALFPLIAGFGMLFGSAMIARWERQQPGLCELSQLLRLRGAMHLPWTRQNASIDDRAFAVYIASHHRDLVTNPEVWSSVYALAMVQGTGRRFAEKSVADHPEPTAEEVREATARLQPLLVDQQAFSLTRNPWFPLVACGVALIVYVGIPALITALLFRGGLVMRALRVAVVRRDGRDARRLRVFWRCLIAWAPVFLAPVLVAVSAPALGTTVAAVLALLLVSLLAAWSFALPEQSLPDRLAGTCLVPR